jgi:LmbE family N-acetylglucosaminyl deacetylase
MTTLMVVHAHPDDEVLTTGGLLARAAEQGLRTVLVTCTGGEAGEIADPSLATPSTLGAVRRRELRAACRVLQISRLHLLGYRDSGMAGSSDNLHPASFWQAPLEQAAARLARLIRLERPEVLVTYDDNGFYGHPDHVRANQITLAALESLPPDSRPRRLYYTAYPHSAIVRHSHRLRASGITPPWNPDAGQPPSFGTPDALITSQLDISDAVDRKLLALRQHASQLCPDFFVSQLSPSLFHELFAVESFCLAASRGSAPLWADELLGPIKDDRDTDNTGPRHAA